MTEALAAAYRAFDDARRLDVDADRIAVPALDDPPDGAVRDEPELGAAPVADLGGRHRAALDHRADALEARERPFVERERVGVAGGFARRRQHGAHQLDSVATGTTDEDVTGAAGVTGL